MATTMKIVQDIVLPDSAIGQNVFWIQAVETLGTGDYTDFDADINAWISDMYGSINTDVSDAVSYGGWKAYTVDVPTGDESFYTSGNASLAAGANVNDAFPNQIAPLVGFLLPGRPRPAAKYIAGFGENTAINNNLQANPILRLLDFALSMRAGPADIGVPNFTWTSGIYSKTDNLFVAAGPTAYANILVSTRRTRKPGVGD